MSDGKSVPKKGFCLCHSFFNTIHHFCTFSENDEAVLDLYTNLMKNSQMVAFFVQILDFGLLYLTHMTAMPPLLRQAVCMAWLMCKTTCT
jgi:hypothetical protein